MFRTFHGPEVQRRAMCLLVPTLLLLAAGAPVLALSAEPGSSEGRPAGRWNAARANGIALRIEGTLSVGLDLEPKQVQNEALARVRATVTSRSSESEQIAVRFEVPSEARPESATVLVTRARQAPKKQEAGLRSTEDGITYALLRDEIRAGSTVGYELSIRFTAPAEPASSALEARAVVLENAVPRDPTSVRSRLHLLGSRSGWQVASPAELKEFSRDLAERKLGISLEGEANMTWGTTSEAAVRAFQGRFVLTRPDFGAVAPDPFELPRVRFPGKVRILTPEFVAKQPPPGTNKPSAPRVEPD